MCLKVWSGTVWWWLIFTREHKAQVLIAGIAAQSDFEDWRGRDVSMEGVINEFLAFWFLTFQCFVYWDHCFSKGWLLLNCFEFLGWFALGEETVRGWAHRICADSQGGKKPASREAGSGCYVRLESNKEGPCIQSRRPCSFVYFAINSSSAGVESSSVPNISRCFLGTLIAWTPREDVRHDRSYVAMMSASACDSCY